jgi:hypothetical protein
VGRDEFDVGSDLFGGEKKNVGPQRKPGPNDEVILAEFEGRELTELEEQAIRDRFGYAPTERRTRAERAAAAAGMVRRSSLATEPLPADIERVWGEGRLDSSGMLAADTARYLIGEWGVDRFRASAVHRGAREDRRRASAARVEDAKPEGKKR